MTERDAVRGEHRLPGSAADPGTRLRAGDALIPAGTATMLVGLIGDVVSHLVWPAAHAHEALLVIGVRGNNPWHLVLVAGVLLTGVGALRWAIGLWSPLGAVVAAGLAILLVGTILAGIYSGWNARQQLALAASSPHIHASGATTATATHQHDGVAETTTAGLAGFPGIGEHVHGTPGPVTPAQRVVLDEQLVAAKTATAKYRDYRRAVKDGYFQVTQYIPGIGMHMFNLHISEGTFDPARPQLLLYEPDGKGWRLDGVAYFISTRDRSAPIGFAGQSDVWHYHTDLCFLPHGAVTIATSGSQCHALGGVFQARTPWLLHAWIWKANPNGVFTEVNPTVS
jgi:hypothetical protein